MPESEETFHRNALEALRKHHGIDGIEAAMQCYPPSHIMRHRTWYTLTHVEAGISPAWMARQVVQYQIEFALAWPTSQEREYAEIRRVARAKGRAKKESLRMLDG